MDTFSGTERFKVLREVGTGAYGVVYAVHDRELEATIALKTLSHTDPASLYRFKREFRAHADLSHPNLVRLHELTCENDLWFFTMELVEGPDFVDHARGLADRPGLASEAFAALRASTRQLARGVLALHEAGTLHRDLKPSNVLVAADGRVVILDFGLFSDLRAGLLYESADQGVIGTPAYMAPELGSGEPPSVASDWYSVGSILFEALTGRLPFEGNFVEMMLEKQQQPAPPVAELRPDTPSDLERLCDDLLLQDPDQRPQGAEVLQRLGGGEVVAIASRSASASRPGDLLVGRDGELAALWAAFDDRRENRPQIVLVHGESGLGKTALVHHFLRELRERIPDAVTLVGRCYQNETVPFKAFDSLVDVLSRYLRALPTDEASPLIPSDVLALARLFPVLRRVEAVSGAARQVLEIPDSHELRRRAFSALRKLLAAIAQRHPVVVFIDDLQWGDADSAALLIDLMRSHETPSLLLVGAYREEDVVTSPLLSELLVAQPFGGQRATARSLPVQALSSARAEELALVLLGESTPEAQTMAASIAAESGGNPFFIDELVRQVRVVASDGDLGFGATPAGSLDDVIRHRVAKLPRDARRLLEVIAVAGQPVALESAQRAAGLPSDDPVPFAILRLGRLARANSGRRQELVETYHDRVREAITAALAPGEAEHYHRRLAQELETTERADPETLAIHFAAGGQPDRAMDYAIAAAAKSVEALAFDRAARSYRLALDLQTANAPADRLLYQRLAFALVNAGRGAEAAAAFLATASGAPAADALEMRRRAAEQLLISGHIDEGLDALRHVLASVGVPLAASPRRALASLLYHRLKIRVRGLGFRARDPTQIAAAELTRIDTCWSAAVGLGIVDTMRGAVFQARHLLLALRAGEIYRIARALAVEVGYSATGGGRTRVRTAALVRQTFELVARCDNPQALGLATMTSGLAAFLEGRWKSAAEQLEKAEEILRTRCTGVAWELDNAHFYSLRSLAFLGEIRELQERLPALLQEARERGDLYALTNIQTRVGWLVSLTRDDPERARSQLREAIEDWSQEGFHLQHFWNLVGTVETDLYEHLGRRPWERLTAAWPDLERSLLTRIQGTLIEAHFLRARTGLAAAAASAGEDAPDELLAAAEESAGIIAAEKLPWATPLAQLIRAGVATIGGDREAALELVTVAEGGFTAAQMALHATVARHRRAELLSGDAARSPAAEVAGWMDRQQVRRPARLVEMLSPGRW